MATDRRTEASTDPQARRNRLSRELSRATDTERIAMIEAGIAKIDAEHGAPPGPGQVSRGVPQPERAPE